MSAAMWWTALLGLLLATARTSAQISEVHLTLAPSSIAPSALYVSFATPRQDEAEEAPTGTGVYYRVQGSSSWTFVPASVTSYNHTSLGYGYYVSPWFHHALLDKDLEAEMVVEYAPAEAATTDGKPPASAATYSYQTPSLASAYGGDSEQKTVLVLMGDLGQTEHSATTVQHIIDNDFNTDTVLLVGDLSYADNNQTRWETWAELTEQIFTKKALMTLPGNHEIETDIVDDVSFKPYASRYPMMPTVYNKGGYDFNSWKANMWYSFEVGNAHIIHLSSYHPFGTYSYATGEVSEQYAWLSNDLISVDRSKTPWIIANMHAPWYNSNVNHHNEIQAVGMRESMEDLFQKFSVSVVFAGHVHAYERMHPTCLNHTMPGCPTFINIGDGGNREGIYGEWLPGQDGAPAPDWSAFRQGSYGHGVLTLMNSTTALWEWHRNKDPEWYVEDSVVIENTYFMAKPGEADTSDGGDDDDGDDDEGGDDDDSAAAFAVVAVLSNMVSMVCGALIVFFMMRYLQARIQRQSRGESDLELESLVQVSK